jgi:hypothetical protein
MSPSSIPQNGPAATLQNSMTLIPWSGVSIWFLNDFDRFAIRFAAARQVRPSALSIGLLCRRKTTM